jgi:hypothetical protein
MPPESTAVIDSTIDGRWIGRTWWVVFPCFAVLTARLAAERTCGDSYQLLSQVTSRATLGWLLAAVYVSAHWWLLAVYLVTVRRTGMLLPTIEVTRMVWGNQSAKIFLLLAALVLEYAPVSIWRAIGARFGAAC